MLVVEGKSRKSIILLDKLKEWNKKDTLILDTVGFNSWDPEVTVLSFPNTSVDQLIKLLTDKKEVTEKYKRIVFYVNCPKEDEFKVWKLEKDLMITGEFRECVITIQNNNMNELSIYEI
jgi:hypothetical protein